MLEIGLIGGGFMHAPSSTLDKHPRYFSWVKNEIRDTTFFIDFEIGRSGLQSSYNCQNKIAWLVESREIVPGASEWIKQNSKLLSSNYKYLFTHDKSIYELEDNFIFVPSHCSWIDEPKIYNKTKLCSMISSNKGWTEGHRRRLSWIEKFRDKVDLFGRGFNEIAKKEEALADYYFSICIENDQYNSYFSEKLLDCFATGTVPIYSGSPDIFEHFNKDGIILLNDNFSVDKLTIELYNSMLPAIRENLDIATKYNTIEDLIFDKYLTWLH